MCFLYLPLLSNVAYGGDYKTSTAHYIRMCESYRGHARGACFAGIGATNAYVLEMDISVARAICEQFEKEGDQAACNYGQVQIALENRKSKLFQFCTSLSTGKLQSVCYQSMFARLHLFQGVASVKEAASAYCNSSPRCLRESERYFLEPWDEIQRVF
jgi:hypothetical protein